MKQLKLKDIKSMRDYSYNQFISFIEMSNIIEDEKELSYKMLEIFFGIKKKDVKLLSIEQYEDLINRIALTFEKELILQNIIILKGVEYGLIPNFEKITAGELIDLDTLLKEDKWIEIMSILYRPLIGNINDKGEYRIEQYDEYDDKFKDIDAYTLLSCKSFFVKSFQILNRYTHTSMVTPTMK